MNTPFSEKMLMRAKSAPEFTPQVHYDKDGDCIEFLASNDPFYGKRIDSLVTVYYSEESNEIVGSLIKGVRQFIDRMVQLAPGFKIEVEDGKIRLEHLFTAKLWHEQPPEERKEYVVTYKMLRDVAEHCDATAELCTS